MLWEVSPKLNYSDENKTILTVQFVLSRLIHAVRSGEFRDSDLTKSDISFHFRDVRVFFLAIRF